MEFFAYFSITHHKPPVSLGESSRLFIYGRFHVLCGREETLNGQVISIRVVRVLFWSMFLCYSLSSRSGVLLVLFGFLLGHPFRNISFSFFSCHGFGFFCVLRHGRFSHLVRKLSNFLEMFCQFISKPIFSISYSCYSVVQYIVFPYLMFSFFYFLSFSFFVSGIS